MDLGRLDESWNKTLSWELSTIPNIGAIGGAIGTAQKILSDCLVDDQSTIPFSSYHKPLRDTRRFYERIFFVCPELDYVVDHCRWIDRNFFGLP